MKVPDKLPSGSPFDAQFVGALAELMEGARMQKAIFDSYVEAGFTPDQSLAILVGLVRSQTAG